MISEYGFFLLSFLYFSELFQTLSALKMHVIQTNQSKWEGKKVVKNSKNHSVFCFLTCRSLNILTLSFLRMSCICFLALLKNKFATVRFKNLTRWLWSLHRKVTGKWLRLRQISAAVLSGRRASRVKCWQRSRIANDLAMWCRRSVVGISGWNQ